MKFNSRGFTSLLLTLATVAMSFSGVMLYMTPRGRVANWTGWTLLGLSKETWVALHMNVALLFVLVTAVHLVLNWTLFWCYIKKRTSFGLNLKTEMAIATVLTGAVLAGAVYDVPPFSTVTALNRQIKDSWEGSGSDAPAPHAEEFSLERIAANMNLSAQDVAVALREKGIAVSDLSTTVGQIAVANGVTPQDVHAAIKQRFPQSNDISPEKKHGQVSSERDHSPGEGLGKGMGRGNGMGMGRGMGKRMSGGMGKPPAE